MDHLEERHPEVYQHSMQGFHVIRISQMFSAGLSSDLIIEQVLMRSLKTTCGLTRGGGMGETQRLIWLLSSSVTSEVNLAMPELCAVSYESSERHKDTSTTRMAKDDTHKMVAYLSSRNPFTDHLELFSLVTGMVLGRRYVSS
jgi:hypothetical protein